MKIQSYKFERAFIGYGIEHGTHVAMVFPSSATWIAAFLALIHIGAVPICINAVMSVHYKVLNNIMEFSKIFKYTKEDKILTSLPMYHVMGCFFTCLLVFMEGASLVLMSKFKTIRAIQALEEEECTSFHGVPTMFKLIMNKMGGYKFPRLDKGMIAGSYCEREAMEDIMQKMGMRNVLPLYGQSEGSGYTQIRIGDPIEKVLTTVDRPIEGVKIKIVDNEMQELPAGMEGEIIVESQYTMAGYYKDPEATAKVLEGGWIHTGDLGKVDEEGKKLQEEVLINEIKEHSAALLAKQKCPKFIRFVEEFPLTGSGKIQKTKLAKIVFG